MKYLGIDYGTKDIGIAISDEEGRVAFPKIVIRNSKNLVQEIVLISRAENAPHIVVGESRDFGGRPNEIFSRIEILKNDLESKGFSVFLEREHWSTAEAARYQGNVKNLDASAAAIILQRFLDRPK